MKIRGGSSFGGQKLTADTRALYYQAVRNQVLHYVRERNLLRAGDRVAVAVSGGADSVALLRVLLELRGELGIVIAVAHFNHQLRGAESDSDEQFVAELAAKHDLPFFAGRGDVRGHADINHRSLEHAARFLRYQWLIDLAHQERFDAIATAHNSDDQAETVLMKFLRGAGTKGLAGIHPVLVLDEVPIIRPLLETPRAGIETYLDSLRQPWREDHTNLDTQHTRNRIRHELLPLLERDYNPNLRQLLAETAEVALGEEDFWQTTVGLERIARHPQPCSLLLSGFELFHVSLQRRLLKQFLEREGFPPAFHHIEDLRRCALGQTPVVGLPGDWLARREADRLQLIPARPPASELTTAYEYRLPIPGSCHAPLAGLTLQATVVPAEAAALEPSGTLLLLDRIGSPLTLRNWQPGDRFRPAHTGSEEKLKRLFSEKRIPADQRRLWPVALAGNEIVWVRGFPVAHDFAWVPGCGDALRLDVLPDA